MVRTVSERFIYLCTKKVQITCQRRNHVLVAFRYQIHPRVAVTLHWYTPDPYICYVFDDKVRVCHDDSAFYTYQIRDEKGKGWRVTSKTYFMKQLDKEAFSLYLKWIE